MLEAEIKVWDPVVRVFHWTLVLAFFVAYFTEPEDAGFAVHVWAGYLVTGLIALRVFWGFVGTRHARFGDFAFAPVHAIRYLLDLARGRATRHLGHSPAGAWMVYALLVTLGFTVLTGMGVLAIEQQAGPLAPIFAASENAATATPSVHPDARGEHEDLFEEAHEVLANIAIALVALHILGVVVASVAHRENLVRSMVTGRKRAEP